MKSSIIRQNQEYWEKHILEAAKFNGSVLAYCKQQGLASQTFYRWRSRIKKQKSSLKNAPVKSSFLSVKIKDPIPLPAKSRLPDPKWMAEFILHLQSGI